MPADGIKLMRHEDILSYEEIAETVRTLIPFGIKKIRFTGGEPLVRKGLEDLVKMVAEIDGVEDISITTNGIFLAEKARQLADNGLNRVNVSLDTLDPEKFKKLTRGGDLSKVLKGIEAAQKAGLNPVKINCVKTADFNRSEQEKLKSFCTENGLQLRYIRQMNLSDGEFWQVEGGDGGNCKSCNRIRLMANGDFKNCLFGEQSFNLRELGIVPAFEQAISSKPFCGSRNTKNEFYNIGG
jgi:cyclic pyranopterin phosphate synthase